MYLSGAVETIDGSRGMHLVMHELAIHTCLCGVAVDPSAIPGPGVVPVLAPHARIRLGTTQWVLLKAVEACTGPGIIF